MPGKYWRSTPLRKEQTMTERSKQMLKAIEAQELEEDEDSEYVTPHPPSRAAQVYSIRIPAERLAELRRVARAKDSAPSTLIREWVIERLDAEQAATRAHVYEFSAISGPNTGMPPFKVPDFGLLSNA